MTGGDFGLTRKVFFLFCWLLGLSIVWTVPAGAAPFSVTVDGQEVVFDVEPVLEEGRVLVPLRAVFQKMGAVVDWLPGEQKAEIKKGVSYIELKPGENRGKVNGVFYPLDVPARVIGGRTLIPLRFVGEALGAGVSWLGLEGGVEILTGDSFFTGSVWGYYVDAKSYESLSNNLDKVDGVIFNSYQLGENGEVKETVHFSQGMTLAAAREMGLWAMVFQSDGQVLHEFLQEEEAWERAARSILGHLSSRGYLGVNLDLEMALPGDRESLTAFVSFLGDELEKEGYLLSLSLPAKTGDDISWYRAYDYESLGAIAHQVVLMAYDQHYAGSLPGPVASLDWVEKVVRYAVQVIPPEKICLGIGLYGYDWPSGNKGRVVDLHQVNQLRQNLTGEDYFDQVYYAPSIRYLDEEGVEHQVWYENQASVRGKLEVAEKYGLGGIAFWRLGLIPPEVWDLVRPR